MTTAKPELHFSHAALEAFASICTRLDSGEKLDLEAVLTAQPVIRDELSMLLANRDRLGRLFNFIAANTPLLDSAIGSAAGLPTPIDEETRDLIDHLSGYQAVKPHYAELDTLAHGGMGIVLRVRDLSIDRDVAMKVVHARRTAEGVEIVDGMRLRRFLNEALLTSRLDHPGIVPVHEIGVDAAGRAYFTMPVVKGRTFADVLQVLPSGEDGWTLPRALEVLLKVCDAVAYAHSTGVIHRDLKPENILVGRFGEVYVMDWGLARSHRSSGESERNVIPTAALHAEEGSSLTMDGEVLGTPSYMAPEQAAGRQSRVDFRADVYALGAILYHVLVGQKPYGEAQGSQRSREILEQVRQGPPAAILQVCPKADRELASVCDKAMARQIDLRYPDVPSLASDLRAFLEVRVVQAHEHGPWAELRKWIRRNKLVSIAILLVVLSACMGLAMVLRAERGRLSAEQERRDLYEVASLDAEAEDLWPAVPDRIPVMQSWINRAQRLLDRAQGHESDLSELRRRALPFDPFSSAEIACRHEMSLRIDQLNAEIEGRRRDIAKMQRESSEPGRAQGIGQKEIEIARRTRALEPLQATIHGQNTWKFRDPDDQERHDALTKFMTAVRSLEDPQEGALASVRSRVELAERVAACTLELGQHDWDVAIESIANPAECPRYGGLRIRPQIGLLPIGADRASGLWEFGVAATGRMPERKPDGKLSVDAHDAIVLVLIPPGEFAMGLDFPPNAEPGWAIRERPAHCVKLGAYFLSKYEMTQAQWLDLAGNNPSYYAAGTHFEQSPGYERTMDLKNPVEEVNWFDCQRMLARVDLELPTEAQWEYACRADTTGWWSLGENQSDLARKVNTAAYTSERSEPESSFLPFDGYKEVAPVDSFEPNPWGLYNVHGNVAEWAADYFWVGYWQFDHRAGDGKQLSPDSGLRVARGSSFWGTAWDAGSANRSDQNPRAVGQGIGVRPARRLDP